MPKETGAASPFISEFSSVDFTDTLGIQFYNPILAQDFGPFKKGDEVGSVDMDYEEGVIQIWRKRTLDETKQDTVDGLLKPDWQGKFEVRLIPDA